MKYRLLGALLLALRSEALATTAAGDHAASSPFAGSPTITRQAALETTSFFNRNPDFNLVRDCRPSNQAPAGPTAFSFTLNGPVHDLLATWVSDEMAAAPPRIRGPHGFDVSDLNQRFNDPQRFLSWVAQTRGERGLRLSRLILAKREQLDQVRQSGAHLPPSESHPSTSALYEAFMRDVRGRTGELVRAAWAAEGLVTDLRGRLKILETVADPNNEFQDVAERLRNAESSATAAWEAVPGRFYDGSFLDGINPENPLAPQLAHFAPEVRAWIQRNAESVVAALRRRIYDDEFRRAASELAALQQARDRLLHGASETTFLIAEMLRHRQELPFLLMMRLQNGAGSQPSLGFGFSVGQVTHCQSQFLIGRKTTPALIQIDAVEPHCNLSSDESHELRDAAAPHFERRPSETLPEAYVCTQRPSILRADDPRRKPLAQ